jgi:DNA-binding XRE family transcriptional regulator
MMFLYNIRSFFKLLIKCLPHLAEVKFIFVTMMQKQSLSEYKITWGKKESNHWGSSSSKWRPVKNLERSSLKNKNEIVLKSSPLRGVFLFMSYTNKLSHYRTKANLTQQEVAYLLGIESTSRLSQWEQGNTMPSLPNIFKLSIIYKVPVEGLYRPLLKKLNRFYITHHTFSETKRISNGLCRED